MGLSEQLRDLAKSLDDAITPAPGPHTVTLSDNTTLTGQAAEDLYEFITTIRDCLYDLAARSEGPAPEGLEGEVRGALEVVVDLGARLGRGEVIGGTPYAAKCWNAIATLQTALASRPAPASHEAEPADGSVVEALRHTVRAMWDEYMRDEECDYTKINRLIEVAYEQAAHPSPAGISREEIARIIHRKIGFAGEYGESPFSKEQCDDAADAILSRLDGKSGTSGVANLQPPAAAELQAPSSAGGRGDLWLVMARTGGDYEYTDQPIVWRPTEEYADACVRDFTKRIADLNAIVPQCPAFDDPDSRWAFYEDREKRARETAERELGVALDATFFTVRLPYYPVDHDASVAAAQRSEAGCAGKETLDDQ